MMMSNNNMPFRRKILRNRISQSQWRWRLNRFAITSGEHTCRYKMTNTRTHPDDSGSATVVFSLRSDQDPSGLLLLPPKGAPSDFDISPILSVMETLLLVATREVRGLLHMQYFNCFIMLLTVSLLFTSLHVLMKSRISIYICGFPLCWTVSHLSVWGHDGGWDWWSQQVRVAVLVLGSAG